MLLIGLHSPLKRCHWSHSGAGMWLLTGGPSASSSSGLMHLKLAEQDLGTCNRVRLPVHSLLIMLKKKKKSDDKTCTWLIADKWINSRVMRRVAPAGLHIMIYFFILPSAVFTKFTAWSRPLSYHGRQGTEVNLRKVPFTQARLAWIQVRFFMHLFFFFSWLLSGGVINISIVCYWKQRWSYDLQGCLQCCSANSVWPSRSCTDH